MKKKFEELLKKFGEELAKLMLKSMFPNKIESFFEYYYSGTGAAMRGVNRIRELLKEKNRFLREELGEDPIYNV